MAANPGRRVRKRRAEGDNALGRQGKAGEQGAGRRSGQGSGGLYEQGRGHRLRRRVGQRRRHTRPGRRLPGAEPARLDGVVREACGRGQAARPRRGRQRDVQARGNRGQDGGQDHREKGGRARLHGAPGKPALVVREGPISVTLNTPDALNYISKRFPGWSGGGRGAG